MFIYIDEMGIGIFTGFGIIIALKHIYRILILKSKRET
jgi:hypothetical protein